MNKLEKEFREKFKLDVTITNQSFFGTIDNYINWTKQKIKEYVNDFESRLNKSITATDTEEYISLKDLKQIKEALLKELED